MIERKIYKVAVQVVSQDGCRSHKVIFTAGSKNAAAELIIYRLWGFFEDRLEEKDEKELIEDGYLN